MTNNFQVNSKHNCSENEKPKSRKHTFTEQKNDFFFASDRFRKQTQQINAMSNWSMPMGIENGRQIYKLNSN